MEEIWKPVKNFEKYYEVSNQQKVKRLERAVCNGRGIKKLKSTIIEGRIRNDGYKAVHILNKDKLLHIIVAEAFPEICGEWFEGAVVHHINGIKTDNRPENLIVLTNSDHIKLHYKTAPDSFKKPSEKRNKAISNAVKGKRRVYKHKPVIQQDINGNEIKKWDCIADVQKEMGYSAGNICMCCKGQLKTAYGFKWQYAVNR